MTQVACIGVGTVGSAWAAVFARAGHGVTLFDTDPATVAEIARPRIEATLDQLHDAMPTGETPRDILARIRSCRSLEEAVRKADVVQESVREDIGTKRTVFDEIGRHASADCLLMSSTSALPGSGFLSHIPSPERALVAHPVNPPSHIPLVELCATGQTAPETVEKARAFLVDAGMEPITVNREIDGFILNRLQYTLVAEAMHLVGEGYCSAEGRGPRHDQRSRLTLGVDRSVHDGSPQRPRRPAWLCRAARTHDEGNGEGRPHGLRLGHGDDRIDPRRAVAKAARRNDPAGPGLA